MAEYDKRDKELNKIVATLQNLHTRYRNAASIPDLHERVDERSKCREGIDMANKALSFYMKETI